MSPRVHSQAQYIKTNRRICALLLVYDIQRTGMELIHSLALLALAAIALFSFIRQKPRSKTALKLRRFIHIYVCIWVRPRGVSIKYYKCKTDVYFYIFSWSAARSDSPAVCQNVGNSLTR